AVGAGAEPQEFTIDGWPLTGPARPSANTFNVASDYFRTLGAGMLREPGLRRGRGGGWLLRQSFETNCKSYPTAPACESMRRGGRLGAQKGRQRFPTEMAAGGPPATPRGRPALRRLVSAPATRGMSVPP